MVSEVMAATMLCFSLRGSSEPWPGGPPVALVCRMLHKPSGSVGTYLRRFRTHRLKSPGTFQRIFAAPLPASQYFWSCSGMPRAGFGSTTGHLVSNVQLTPAIDNQLWWGRWIPWKHHRHTIDVERVPDRHRHSVNFLVWGSHTVIVLGVPSLGQLSTGYSGLFDTGRHGARTISTVDLGLGNHFGSVRPALRARVTEYLVNPR